MELGSRRTDNVASIGVGWSYISSVGEAQLNHPPRMMFRDYMRSVAGMSARIMMGEWLAQNVEVAAGTFWGNGVNATASSRMASQGLEPFATLRKVPPDKLIKPFTNAKAI
ncbi:MAG: hypothetical protein H6Q33_4925 [Deltaproteobacteria bacterium]|nr:hypothetical protein [Deltaproteobacteria bacterium]